MNVQNIISGDYHLNLPPEYKNHVGTAVYRYDILRDGGTFRVELHRKVRAAGNLLHTQWINEHGTNIQNNPGGLRMSQVLAFENGQNPLHFVQVSRVQIATSPTPQQILQNQVQNMASQVQVVQATNHQLTQQIHVLNQTLASKKQQEAILTAQVSSLENSIRQLETQVSQIPALREVLNQLTASHASLNEQIRILRESMREILNAII